METKIKTKSKKAMQILLVYSLLFLIVRSARSESYCPPLYYSDGPGTVRFPFRVNPTQPVRCGYPGFDLTPLKTIDIKTRLVINFPNSGNFTVDKIDYWNQNIWISDPNQCLAKRLIQTPINFTGSPFSLDQPESLSLYNCSFVPESSVVVPCLSTGNYTVVIVSKELTPPVCPVIGIVMVPNLYWSAQLSGIRVSWKEPDCTVCEQQRGFCDFQNSRTGELGCFGLQNHVGRSLAMYGLIIAIPGFLCLSCFIFILVLKLKSRDSLSNHLEIRQVAPSIMHPPAIKLGLDESVIQTYPKTYLGESKRLANPDDNICPICLSEYQAKDTLRTIPNCNHYFHADCIDEWLLINALCPLCRA